MIRNNKRAKLLLFLHSMSLWYLTLFVIIFIINRLLRMINSSLLDKVILKYRCAHGYEFYARADDYWRFIDHFEPKTTVFVEEVIRNDDIVIDIGAHIGIHTIHFAKKAKLVIALEPEPQNFSLLRRNIIANGVENVIAYPIAASDKSGYLDLYISTSSGDHTLNPEHGNKVKYYRKIRVKIMTLDTLIKNLKIDRVDVVKIDVEGHEDKILHGMKEILEKRLPRVIIVETDRDSAIINELKNHKYHLLMELDSWGNRINYAFLRSTELNNNLYLGA